MLRQMRILNKVGRFRAFVLMIMSTGGHLNFDSDDEFLRSAMNLFLEHGDDTNK